METRTNRNRLVAVTSVVLLLSSAALSAQSDIFMPPSARSFGMGGAYTAVAEGMDAFYYNPAGFLGEGEFTLLSITGYAFADAALVTMLLDGLAGKGPLGAAMSIGSKAGPGDIFGQFGFSEALVEQLGYVGEYLGNLDSGQLENALLELENDGFITQAQLDAITSAGNDEEALFQALAEVALPLISDPENFVNAIASIETGANVNIVDVVGSGYDSAVLQSELQAAASANAFPSGNVRAGVNLGIGYVGNGFGIGLFVNGDATFTGANLLASRGRVFNTVTIAAGFAVPVGPVKLGAQVRPTFIGYSNVNPSSFFASALSGSPDVSSLMADIYTGFRVGVDVGALLDLGPFTFGAAVKDILPFQLQSVSKYTFSEYGSAFATANFPLGTGSQLTQDELDMLYQVPPAKLNIGVSFHPDLGAFSAIIDPRVSLDIHDLFGFLREKDEFLQNELTILDHINAGAEVTFLKFASVRAGYAKGVVTAGLGIDLPFLELNASAGFGELSTVGDEVKFKTVGATVEFAIRF